MLSRKRKRIRLIFLGLTSLVLSTILVGFGLKDGIEFFKSPSEIINDPPAFNEQFRIGGLVSLNSVNVLKDGSVAFQVTDNISSIEVRFSGVLPDLFAENQGVIALGSYKDGLFYAEEFLAKHDESYMPKEVIDMLKTEGVYVDPRDNSLSE